MEKEKIYPSPNSDTRGIPARNFTILQKNSVVKSRICKRYRNDLINSDIPVRLISRSCAREIRENLQGSRRSWILAYGYRRSRRFYVRIYTYASVYKSDRDAQVWTDAGARERMLAEQVNLRDSSNQSAIAVYGRSEIYR